VIGLVKVGNWAEKHWEDVQEQVKDEEQVIANYKACLADLKRKPLMPFMDKRRATFTRCYQHMNFMALRLQFIEPSNQNQEPLPPDFDFAQYLGKRLGVNLAELIELPLSTWFVLELMSVLMYVIMISVNREVLLWIWVGFGFLQFLVFHVLLAKIEWIREQLTDCSYFFKVPEHDELEVLTGPMGIGWRIWRWFCCCTMEFSNGAGSAASGSGMTGSINDEGTPLLSGAQMKMGKRYMEQEFGQERSFLERKLLGIAPNKHEMLFWFDCRGRDVHHLIVRVVMIGQAIYLAILFYQFVPSAHYYYGNEGVALVTIVAIVPCILIQFVYTPEIIKSNTVITAIEMHKEMKTIKDVIRDQKTAKAIRALVLLQSMQKQVEKMKRLESGEENHEAGERAAALREMEPSKREELERMFDVYDTDKGGSISTSELNALMSSLGHQLDEVQTEAMLHELDENGDGDCSKEEFVGWMALQDQDEDGPGLSVEELAENMFNMFDDDMSGSITCTEFIEAMQKFAPKMSLDEVNDLIRELDDNADGTISKEEFTTLLRTHMVQY
jgi:Ca2+-binding EF-hand superfamily protein